MKYTREDYMQGKCTHDEFYQQFVTEGLKNCVARHIGMDDINASKDVHFNDIALDRWDVCPIPYDVMDEFIKSSGCRLFSLSDRVCITKMAAKILKEASKKIFN